MPERVRGPDLGAKSRPVLLSKTTAVSAEVDLQSAGMPAADTRRKQSFTPRVLNGAITYLAEIISITA